MLQKVGSTIDVRRPLGCENEGINRSKVNEIVDGRGGRQEA